MGLLGKALLGAAKGTVFFLNHGGCDTFYAGVDKLSRAASSAVLNAAEEMNRKSEAERHERNK